MQPIPRDVATRPTSPRHGFIDALRGIAALLVIYMHMTTPVRDAGLVGNDVEAALLWFFLSVIDVGKVGVVVFFAVSGFVIPYTLLKGRWAPVRTFVVNRLFRLYPAYWLSIVLGLVFVWHLQEGRSIPLGIVLVNLTMLQHFVGVADILDPYWTLQIELIFYGLCVLLFATGLLQDRRAVFACAMAMLLISLLQAGIRFSTGQKLPVALTLALAFMFWGCVWRDYILDGNLQARRLGLVFMGTFVFAMPVIALLAYNVDMGFGETWYRYVLSYGAAAVILLAGTTRFRLEGAFFSWLGRISYSVYLMSWPVMAAVMTFVVPVVGRGIPAHGYIVLVMVGTAALSHLVYAYLEKPMIDLGRSLNAALDVRAAPDLAAGA